MELHLAGVSHKSAPVALRERLASLAAPEVLRRLRAAEWREAVVLSTCNRFEIAAVSPDRTGGAPDLAEFIGRLAGFDASAQAYAMSGRAAVEHLFQVASGLDSLVVGEGEILAQVKKAYEQARLEEMTGKVTNVLFQRALFVGKEVRTKTAISAGQTSVASVAVTLAERIFGDLRSSEVLILGAGKMAELASKHLLSSKVARLRIANRTWERAVELAGRLGGEPVAWTAFRSALETADIVIASTGSTEPILARAMLVEAMAARRNRSLFLIDIAMPRDVEESAGDLEHVYLYTLEDLAAIVAENTSSRRAELDRARALALSRAEEFAAWLAAAAAGGTAPLRHAESL